MKEVVECENVVYIIVFIVYGQMD